MNKDKNYWKFQSKKKKFFSKKICMAGFLDDCKGNIVKAHTLSKAKSIIPITKNKEFYVRGYNNSIKIEKSNSINKITIFKGFCVKHDKELFSVFEDKKFCYTKKQCCMLLFRSLSKELYLKKAFLETLEEGEKVIKNRINEYKIEAKSFSGLSNNTIEEDKKSIKKQLIQRKKEEANIPEQKIGTTLAIGNLEHKLKRVKGQIESKNYNSIRYFIIKLPFIIDISFDTGFIPEIEKQGELNKKYFDLFSAVTLFEESETFICFIWDKGQQFCQKFMEKLEKESNIKKAIYSLVFNDARELIIKKSWLDNFSKEQQKEIESKYYFDYFGYWKEKDIVILKNF